VRRLRRRLPAELLALGLLTLSCGLARGDVGTAPVPETSATTASGPRLLGTCDQQGAQECVLNPEVTQATIRTTICKVGWTATVRPPRSYTDALKRQQLAALHAQHPSWTTANTEEDHRMPLELGGSPRDPHNLSPEFADEPLASSPVHNRKDDAENTAKAAVCAGRQTLDQAQFYFVAEWLMAWPDYRK
jgi:hypothetical protein